MGRRPCCEKEGLKKGPWTADEDKKLVDFLLNNGQCCWRAVPKLAGLLRCGKSCRLRWTNYLRPDLKRGLLSESEEKLIIDLHAKLGNRWSKIAAQLPGRTDNEIKNQWNTHIKKKLKKMGIDPLTHKPISLSHEVPNEQKQEQSNSIPSGKTNTVKPENQKEQIQEQKISTATFDPLQIDPLVDYSSWFSSNDVAMVPPNAITVPCTPSVSCSVSPSSSSSLSSASVSFSVPPMEWPESIYLTVMDDVIGHEFLSGDLDRNLSADVAMIQPNSGAVPCTPPVSCSSVSCSVSPSCSSSLSSSSLVRADKQQIPPMEWPESMYLMEMDDVIGCEFLSGDLDGNLSVDPFSQYKSPAFDCVR